MHAFQQRRRKHKPGTRNLKPREVPTRSGSDTPVTYAHVPRASERALGGQVASIFVTNQENAEPESQPFSIQICDEPRIPKVSSRYSLRLLAQAFDATENYSWDENEDFSLEGLLEPYRDNGETEFDVPFIEDRAKISTILLFSRTEISNGLNGWQAWITIKNRTQLNLTYCVVTSPETSFLVKHRIGWILPLGETKVRVETEEDFKTFSQEFMTVFVAPVFFRHQLVHEKLKVLWDALGSTLFPVEQAEEHPIASIGVKDERDLDRFSMLDRAIMGKSGRNTGMLAKVYLKKSKNEALFREYWDIDSDFFEIKLKYSLREIKRTIRRVKVKADMAALKDFNLPAATSIITSIAAVLLGYHWEILGSPYTLGFFRVTGALYGYFEPEPETWDQTLTKWVEPFWNIIPNWVQELHNYFQ